MKFSREDDRWHLFTLIDGIARRDRALLAVVRGTAENEWGTQPVLFCRVCEKASFLSGATDAMRAVTFAIVHGECGGLESYEVPVAVRAAHDFLVLVEKQKRLRRNAAP